MNRVKRATGKILVNFEHPPIPVRNYDYSAVYDDYDGPGSPIGWGQTPDEAIDDLKAQMIYAPKRIYNRLGA